MADTITLKELCEELKLDARLARMKLRDAAKTDEKLTAIHKPRTQWRWLKGSDHDKTIRKIVA